MKKLFLFIVSCFLLSTYVGAQSLIQMSTQIIDKNPLGHPTPKSPIQPPTVYINDYTLSFEAYHPEYVLSIKDEEDEVVYTTVVSSSQTQVILPSTLSGEYKIELIMGNWLFTGWINL